MCHRQVQASLIKAARRDDAFCPVPALIRTGRCFISGAGRER